MNKKEAGSLEHGIYVLQWKEGGASLAAVGSDEKGNRWFAPTNWIHVPSFDWRAVKRAILLLEKSDLEGDFYFDQTKRK